MPTNITIATIESVAVVYLQDGSTIVIEPQSQQSLQLIDNGFCTISEAADPDTAEHPPPLPPFVQRLVDFLRGYKPTATPL